MENYPAFFYILPSRLIQVLVNTDQGSGDETVFSGYPATVRYPKLFHTTWI